MQSLMPSMPETMKTSRKGFRMVFRMRRCAMTHRNFFSFRAGKNVVVSPSLIHIKEAYLALVYGISTITKEPECQ